MSKDKSRAVIKVRDEWSDTATGKVIKVIEWEFSPAVGVITDMATKDAVSRAIMRKLGADEITLTDTTRKNIGYDPYNNVGTL